MRGLDIALALAIVVASLLAACSTVPRQFAPRLSDPDLAGPKFGAMVELCSEWVAAGERSDFAGGALASAGVGAAVGYGAGAVIFMEGLGTSSFSPGDIADLTLVAMPVIGILAAVGYSRHVRNRNENEIQTAMSLCLEQNGYPVEDWVLLSWAAQPPPGDGRTL